MRDEHIVACTRFAGGRGSFRHMRTRTCVYTQIHVCVDTHRKHARVYGIRCIDVCVYYTCYSHIAYEGQGLVWIVHRNMQTYTYSHTRTHTRLRNHHQFIFIFNSFCNTCLKKNAFREHHGHTYLYYAIK